MTGLFSPCTDPQVFSGHTGSLKHVVFMNEGKQMLSCAEDKTVRVWDKTSGQVLASFLVLSAE